MNTKDKTIAVDFDGVINPYSNGWCDGALYEDPKEGCKEALDFFKKLGFRVMIYSARCKNDKNRDAVREYLTKYNIAFDEIYSGDGKPHCCIYIDDNGYRFEGTWRENLPKIIVYLSKYIFEEKK
jgi:hypothetical protein